MTDAPPSLRQDLITAGIELLDQGGMSALTLRRVAARAGVSHAAPAHHFDGLPGLLTAIAAHAFALFADTMAACIAASDSDPFQTLLATCLGYLDFAQRHQGLFYVMFIAPQVDRDHPELVPQSQRSYLLLRAACLPFAAPGATQDAVLETAVWSMVHGYATLGFTRPQTDSRGFTQTPPFDALLRELLIGQQNTA